jgi:hypothetical protein
MARAKVSDSYSDITNIWAPQEEELDENGNPITTENTIMTDGGEVIGDDGSVISEPSTIVEDTPPVVDSNNAGLLNSDTINSIDNTNTADTNTTFSSGGTNDGDSGPIDYTGGQTYDNSGNLINSADGSIVNQANNNYNVDAFGNPLEEGDIDTNNYSTGYDGVTYDNFGNLVNADGSPAGDTNYSAENPFGTGNWNNVSTDDEAPNDGYSEDPTYGYDDSSYEDNPYNDSPYEVPEQTNTFTNDTWNYVPPEQNNLLDGSGYGGFNTTAQDNTFSNETWNYVPPVQNNIMTEDGFQSGINNMSWDSVMNNTPQTSNSEVLNPGNETYPWEETNFNSWQNNQGGRYNNQGVWVPDAVEEPGQQVPAIEESLYFNQDIMDS